jgi:hypothetical protein
VEEHVEDFRFDKVKIDAIFAFFAASIVCRAEVFRAVTNQVFVDMVELLLRPNAYGDDFSEAVC